MPRITVVDVGDGACSVVRCACTDSGCACPTTVVDCGTWRSSPLLAVERLVRVLGVHGLQRLDSLVVTHFDADHWHGLRLLADNLHFAERSTLKLYYPRLPDRAPQIADATLALLVTSRFAGVRSLELATALEEVATVDRHPLARGSEFEACDRVWEVMWPPEQLSRALGERLERAVRLTEDLAEQLDRAGHPTLRRNLEEAYERPFPGGDNQPTREVASELALQGRRAARGQAATEGRQPDRGMRASASGVHGLEAASAAVIPERFRGAFIDASKRLAAANNDLSLVFHDKGGSLAVFGDASRQVLRSALRGMRMKYRAVLAPHHGTYPLPAGFPSAEVCIAQAGDRHVERWPKHVAGHRQPRSCINTAQVGTISVW
ncbi:MBL fold metallo-hydrolase [Micromonospora vinacea]|uniref:MBL fold metallo-hydrolase n=1 Tax=Micromonospora vinacea TaxID=709878 RepID=UPI00344E9E6D